MDSLTGDISAITKCPRPHESDSPVTTRVGRQIHDAAFTLVELLVVLLVIGALLAIAIPTFLSAISSAQDRATESNLRTAVLVATSFYLDSQQSFLSATPSSLSSANPEFDWVTTDCKATGRSNCVGEEVVDVSGASDKQGLILATYGSRTRTCWYAVVLETGPAAIKSDRGSTAFSAKVPTAPANTAGTFYAKQAVTGNKTCKASNAAKFTWGSSVAAAASQ